jgi:hypothetical protein
MTAAQLLSLLSGIAYAIGAALGFWGLWLTGKALSGEATMADLPNLRALLREAGGLRFGYAAAGVFLAGAGLQIAASAVG